MGEVSSEIDGILSHASDDRPIVYRDQGRWVYRASAIGGCPRGLLAARRGYQALPAPDWLQHAADAGNDAEQYALKWLRAQGYQLESLQQAVEWPVGTAVIRGHIDGIARYVRADARRDPQAVADQRVVEVKSMSAKVFGEWRRYGFAAFPRYAAQLSIYMAALKLPALYVIVKRDSAGRPQDVVMQKIQEPPWPLAQVVRRVLQIERWAADDGPTVSWPPCETAYTGWCAWQYLHDAANAEDSVGQALPKHRILEAAASEAEGPPLLDLPATERLIELATLYHEQQLLAKQAEQALKGLKQQLLQAVHGQRTVHAGFWTISQRMNTRSQWDEEALLNLCQTVGVDPASLKRQVTYPDPVLTVKKGGHAGC